MTDARTPQFEIYTKLRELGVDVRSEIRLPAASERSRSGHFFADLAVYRRGQIVALCECKARQRALRGRQRENYDGSGLPWIVGGADNIDEAVRWLERAAYPNGVI